MIRRWASGFLGSLAEMISPSSRKRGGIGNFETPLRGSPLSEAALNKAIAELETVSGGTGPRTHPAPQPLPPDLQDVPERVPSIDPLLAARYWKEALDYVDFTALAATGKKEVKPLAVFEFKTIGDKAGMTSADIEVGAAGGKPPDEELDVHVVVALWENNRRGTREPAGRRHPVMAVPAILVDGEFLAPRTTAAPVINERYLSPQLAAGCFSVGDRDEANGHLTKALVNLIEDPTASPGWGTWWRTSLGVLQELLGIGSADRLEPALAARATEISLSNRKHPSGWGLYAAIYPAGGGGTEAVAKVYRSLASNFGAYPRDMALFQRLCGGANALPVARLPADIDDRLLGHMDEYDGGSRSLFPLDATQRKAVRAILSLKAGEMQAVNGPPGSGKTSMLRAVVASVWVSAALRREDCPILVACGATNQSVTNVIEAFGNAPHPDASVPHARRWISDAASYGAYLPSSSVLNDASKQAELARFVCLKKSSRNGFLYEYVNRNNVLNPAKALEYEQVYLCRARDALLDETGVVGPDTVESAVQLVWQVLDRAERQRRSFEQGLKAGGDAIEMGYRFVQRCEAYWTPTRRKIALDLLERLGGDPRDGQAAQEFMDLSWRAEAFHWAARYWEGRFLLAQRERLFSRHPLNVEEALRRLCMLTPCLVSTLHTAPQFAEIDSVLKTPEDHRSHVFGVIDLLVVDEAGQALPELAGAAFALAKKAAVVGDLKQLAPIWNNSELAEISILNRVLGAEKTAEGPKSILEGIFRSRRSVASGSTLGIARLMSLWKDADDDGVTLQFHYRCKPSIIDYCNHLSYSGTLRPKTNEDEYFPEPALGWVEVEAEPKSVGGSYRNDAEADEIISWIVERWPVWRQDPKTGGKPIQEIVAIITAYRQQADYLKHRLTAAFDQARSRKSGEWPSEKDVEKVTIGTVHRLQGAERPIVCFSLVEGPDQAGGSFIDRDASLLNVAVSRAKRSFIVFANPRRLFRPFAEEDGQTVLAPTHQLGAHLCKRPEAKLLYPDKLVLIESTGKVAALSHLLGKSARVIALGGAPLGLDREKGVNIAAGFVPNPTPEAGARQGLEQAAAAISRVGQVVFATDDDRMGDYIAWQAKRLLAAQLDGCRTGRVLLRCVTKSAVERAFASPVELDDRRILAEATREVVDWAVSRRLREVVLESGGEKSFGPEIALETERLIRIGACADANTPAGGSGAVYDPVPVGRVQGAILRLLLARARHVLAASDLRRIRAVVRVEGETFTGIVYQPAEDRETVEAGKAATAVAKLAGLRLRPAGAPVILREMAIPPAATTVAILASAWAKHRIEPWVAMRSLQALYDGSWSRTPDREPDPYDPIEPSSDMSAHPPITPLDRAAPPELMKGGMDRTDFSIYSLVWDRFTAMEKGEAEVLDVRLDFTLEGKAGDERRPGIPLRVRFGGISGDGVEPAGGNPAASLRKHWRAFDGAAPEFEVVSALDWDCSPGELLDTMERNKVGRPSTYAKALERLHDKQLVQFPHGQGPLRLTPAGVATAITIELAAEALSDPAFSARLTKLLEEIETGTTGPRAVLCDLMPLIAPGHDPAEVGPRIWNTLSELEQAIDSADLPLPAGSLVTAP